MGKKRMTFWMDDKQIVELKILSLATRIKQADFIREGIDMVLSKYQKEIKKAQKKGGE
ncbi:MAG: ribbon-helix-helix domain-containing protein [Proteobacteria bacterium]|nr:ribbon-helix-helix domain-containing protein [Pseudomonadota bacterium]